MPDPEMTADEALAEMELMNRSNPDGWQMRCHAALSAEIAALRERVKELEGEALNQSRIDRRCVCGNPSELCDNVDVCCDCGGYRP